MVVGVADGSAAPLPHPVRAPNMQASTNKRRTRPDLGMSCLRLRPTKAAVRSPGIQRNDAENTSALPASNGRRFRGSREATGDVLTVTFTFVGPPFWLTLTDWGVKVQVVPAGALGQPI